MRYISLTFFFFLGSILAFAVPVAITNASLETELVNRGYDTDATVNGQMEVTDILAITNLNLANSSLMTGGLDLSNNTAMTGYCFNNTALISIDLKNHQNIYAGNIYHNSNLSELVINSSAGAYNTLP
jgi:hypothetical protein